MSVGAGRCFLYHQYHSTPFSFARRTNNVYAKLARMEHIEPIPLPKDFKLNWLHYVCGINFNRLTVRPSVCPFVLSFIV